MKILLNLIWSIVLLPFILFVKGDLNFNALKEFSTHNIGETISNSIENNLKDQSVDVVVKVKVIAKTANFTGAGLGIELLDTKYQPVAKSQIISKHVVFKISKEAAKQKYFIVYSKFTQDELLLDITKGGELTLNEPDIQ